MNADLNEGFSASGFFEWKSEQGVKQPWFISLKSGEPMAIAGLWETWHPNTDESTTSCCIITTDANVLMESIHDRMPVILDRELWATWLSLQEHRADELLPLIRPHDAVAMQARLVTHELNRVDCAMMRGWWSGRDENHLYARSYKHSGWVTK